MLRILIGSVAIAAGVTALAAAPPPQTASAAKTIDFARDVQPIFKDHCYECHGPERQSNGLRLDRRRDAMRGANGSVIGPGSAQSSHLYLRLIGSDYGERMPKDGQLSAADIETIKQWIDQGAVWPDAVSGDPPPTPPDPGVVAVLGAFRAGNTARVLAALRADPQLPHRRGDGSATPLMYAALYGDAALVRAFLDAGGDARATNDWGSTALMWAGADLAKVRLLIDHGADVNAKTIDSRTPLIIASGFPDSIEVARLLLEKGAKANASAPWLGTVVTPLTNAARRADLAMIQLLLDHGATIEGPDPLVFAFMSRSAACLDIIAAHTPPPLVTVALSLLGPPISPAVALKPLLARGADPLVKNPDGFNLLMLAAATESAPVDEAKLLMARGIPVNAAGPDGLTALSLARRHGETPMVDLLVNAGATDSGVPVPAPPMPAAVAAATAREAAARTLPGLQKADRAFLSKSGCVSCHNNTVVAETVALARSRNLPVDETIAEASRRRIGSYLDDWRDRALVDHGIPGDIESISFILAGLAAEKYPASASTDAMTRFIRLHQNADGSWTPIAERPPIEGSSFSVTAYAVTALRAYTAPVDRGAANGAITRAAGWLRSAEARTNEDYVFRLVGLTAAGADRAAIQAAAAALWSRQNLDGGWAQLSTLASDAYATGEALTALIESRAVTTADARWQRGERYLMSTERPDGTWFVKSRAVRLQPPLDAGFPYGSDQFISSAATAWAARALLHDTSAARSAIGSTPGPGRSPSR